MLTLLFVTGKGSADPSGLRWELTKALGIRKAAFRPLPWTTEARLRLTCGDHKSSSHVPTKHLTRIRPLLGCWACSKKSSARVSTCATCRTGWCRPCRPQRRCPLICTPTSGCLRPLDTDDPPVQGIHRSEQGCRSVALVVPRHGFGTPLFERQPRLSPLQCLHLAFLVAAEHQRMLRRRHVTLARPDRTSFVSSTRSPSVSVIVGATRIVVLHPGLIMLRRWGHLCFFKSAALHQVGVPMNDRQINLLNNLLDGFDGKLASSKWAAIGKCSQDTALRNISDLVERGILEKSEASGRSTSYEVMTMYAPT